MAPLSLNILFKVNQLSGLNRLEMADTHVFFTIFSTRACESLYRKNNQHVCLFFFYTREKKEGILFFSLTSGLEISRKKKVISVCALQYKPPEAPTSKPKK